MGGNPLDQVFDQGVAAVEVHRIILGEGAQSLVRIANLLRDSLHDFRRGHDVDTHRPAEITQELVDLEKAVLGVGGHRPGYRGRHSRRDVRTRLAQVGHGSGPGGRDAGEDLEGERTQPEDVVANRCCLAGHLLRRQQTPPGRRGIAIVDQGAGNPEVG